MTGRKLPVFGRTVTVPAIGTITKIHHGICPDTGSFLCGFLRITGLFINSLIDQAAVSAWRQPFEFFEDARIIIDIQESYLSGNVLDRQIRGVQKGNGNIDSLAVDIFRQRCSCFFLEESGQITWADGKKFRDFFQGKIFLVIEVNIVDDLLHGRGIPPHGVVANQIGVFVDHFPSQVAERFGGSTFSISWEKRPDISSI